MDQFVHVNHLDTATCAQEPVQFAETLGPQCPLFARKVRTLVKCVLLPWDRQYASNMLQ